MSPKERLSTLCGAGAPDQEKHENVIVNVFPCFETYTPGTWAFVFVMEEVEVICYFQDKPALFWRHYLEHERCQAKEILGLVVQSFGSTYCWARKFVSFCVKQDSVYTFINCEVCEGVKSGRQETGDILSPGCLIKSISFPMAAARYRIIRMCLYGAIQEVIMLPPNWVSFNSRVINLCYYWILPQLIM